MKTKITILFLVGTFFFTACGGVTPVPVVTSIPMTVPPVSAPIPTPTQNRLGISVEAAKDVIELKKWGQGNPYEIAWSPDGLMLAITTSTGIYLYDAGTLMQKKIIDIPHALNPTFSLDNQYIAVSGCSNYDPFHTCNGSWLSLVDITREEVVYKINPGYGNILTAIKFSPDGNMLVGVGCNDERGPGVHCVQGKITVLDVVTGNILHEMVGHKGYVTSVAFSPDGKYIVSSSSRNLWVKNPASIIMWDVKTGKQISEIPVEKEMDLYAVVFSEDGKKVFLSDRKGNPVVWDIETQSFTYVTKENDFESRLIVADGSRKGIAVGDAYREIQIWDMHSEKISLKISPSETVISIAFNLDGDELVGLTKSGIIFWDAKTGNVARSYDWGSHYWIKASGQLPNGQWVIAGESGSFIHLLDGMTGRLIQEFDISNVSRSYGVSPYPYNLAISPDGQLLAYGSESHNGALRVWNIQTGKLLIEKMNEAVGVVVFSRDNHFLATGGAGGSIKVWDISNLDSMSSFISFVGHKGYLNQMIFSQDGKQLISVASGGIGEGENDYTLRVWDIPSGKLLHTVNNYFLSHTTLSPNGHTIVGSTSFTWGHMELIDLLPFLHPGASLSEMPYFHDEYGQFTTFAFDSIGEILAWADVESEYDSSITLWDVEKRQSIIRLKGHTSWINFLSFSPDGRYIISSSADGTTRLWGLK